MDIQDIRKIILEYCYPKNIQIGNVLQITKTKNIFLQDKLFVYAGKYDNIVSMIEYNNFKKKNVMWYCIHHLNLEEHKFRYISNFGYHNLKEKTILGKHESLK